MTRTEVAALVLIIAGAACFTWGYLKERRKERAAVSAPDSVWTAQGIEISTDRSGSFLQLALSDRREPGPAWHLVTDLTAAEVAQLHRYLGDWLAEFAPSGDTAAGFDWERHNHSEIVPCVKGLCPGYG